MADYCLEHGLPYHPTELPVPLEMLVAHGLDFQRRYVPDLEEHTVTSVIRHGRGFSRPRDGEELRAEQVVVAAGITHFASVPRIFEWVSPELVSHSSTHHDSPASAASR